MIMKKVLLSLAAMAIAGTASSQLPTTTKELGLKGNVLSVEYYKYEYKENFGEPTEGNLEEINSTFFDENGRSVVFRTGRVMNSGREVYPYTYIYSYSKDEDKTKIDITEKYDNGRQYDKLTPINQYLNKFGKTTTDLENQYNENGYPKHRGEIYKNSDDVITKLDLYSRSGQAEKEKLVYRRVAKPLGNGVYEFTVFNKYGETALTYKETYKNGLLVSIDNKDRREYKYSDGHPLKIVTPAPGKKTYNAKGQIVSYTDESSTSMTFEYKCYYNDKGDLEKVTCGQVGKPSNDHEIYGNYKYDSHGNWIYRTVFCGYQKNIEKRVIEYCSSADELKAKSHFIEVPDNKSENEFLDFYSQNMKHKSFTAKIPLSVYDVNQTSQPEASDIIITVVLIFDADNTCQELIRAGYDETKKIKKKKMHEILREQYNIGEYEKIPYKYNNGIITMKGDQYKFESGTLVNVTKNYRFTNM